MNNELKREIEKIEASTKRVREIYESLQSEPVLKAGMFVADEEGNLLLLINFIGDNAFGAISLSGFVVTNYDLDKFKPVTLTEDHLKLIDTDEVKSSISEEEGNYWIERKNKYNDVIFATDIYPSVHGAVYDCLFTNIARAKLQREVGNE